MAAKRPTADAHDAGLSLAANQDDEELMLMMLAGLAVQAVLCVDFLVLAQRLQARKMKMLDITEGGFPKS